jgi:hypothetical protein
MSPLDGILCVQRFGVEGLELVIVLLVLVVMCVMIQG